MTTLFRKLSAGFGLLQIVHATLFGNETFRNGTKIGQRVQPRPIVYTYFERIPLSNRTTGMSDANDDELLESWKMIWHSAGYDPVVLTEKNICSSEQAVGLESNTDDSYLTKTQCASLFSKMEQLPLDDFCRVLFHRWMAMATVGGGWYSDYDNFPLRPYLEEDTKGSLQKPLPNNGKMTIFNIGAPTLASGSGKEWFETLEALVDDANDHCAKTMSDCFYTDSLAIYSIRKKEHKMSPRIARQVAVPFDKNDPVSFNDSQLCSSKQFRSKWTVHFGPENLQRGRHVPSGERLPHMRSRLAKTWLSKWISVCDTN